MQNTELEIIYQDEYYVAVNKPAGLLVHPTLIDKHEKISVQHLIQDQINQPVFIVHRLDKPTSGVLLLALSSEAARKGAEEFMRTEVRKTYLAIVRGYTKKNSTITSALKDVPDKILDKKHTTFKEPKSAHTEFRQLAQTELPVSISRYPKSRYSLIEVHPKTGRMHQIRRHLKHIRHPIIGDTKYGDHLHNRYFREDLKCERILLASMELSLIHPYIKQPINIAASLDTVFTDVLRRFRWLEAVPEQWLENSVSTRKNP